MSILPKAFPIKILMAYFTDLEQIFKSYMNPNSLSNLQKEERSWRDLNT